VEAGSRFCRLLLVCKADASRNPTRWGGPYASHDLEDIALLMGACTILERSLRNAPSRAVRYLSAWAGELTSGSTRYGQQAYACLEGNWPREVRFSVLDHLLETMTSPRGQ